MDNKVPQQINDIVGDNVKKLAQLFPSAVKDGEVDFEALKEELGQYEGKRSNPCTLTFKRPLTTVFLFSDVFWQLW